VPVPGEELDRRVGNAEVVRDAFENMPALVAALEGPEHRMVAANGAYRAFAGRPDFIGKTARQVFPDVAGQQLFELLDRVYASGEPVTASEWRIQLDRDGDSTQDEVYLDFSLTPWRAADGGVRGILVVQTDVTDQVRQRAAARHTAVTAERRYQAARSIVTTLQQALLPAALPVLPGVQLAARYLVSGQDQAAGGDWFDAIPLPDGTVALVVGDVVGHGVAALAAMGQLRAVLTERLTAQPDLAVVLDQVDTFAARNRALRAATLCLVLLNPATGQLQYATCGHPAPLAIGTDGSARYLAPTGMGPLGTRAGSRAGPAPVTELLAPGETVFLYSDGLIERPGRTMAEALAELATVAAAAAANQVLPVGAAASRPERICQLTVELLTRTGYADDVTVLAAQRGDTPMSPLALERPAVRDSLAPMREAFTGWLDGFRPVEDDRLRLTMAVSEAITNAIEHAYPAGRAGPVWLVAIVLPDGFLEVNVADRGRWQEPGTDDDDRGHGLLVIGQLADEMEVQHPPHSAIEPSGARGTTVMIRHRLRHPAMLATDTDTDTDTAAARQPADPPFTVRIMTGEPRPRVRITGPVDITTTGQLTRSLLTACRGGVLPLIADLDEVTLLASAGVRALFEVTGQLAAHQQDFTLIAGEASAARAVLDLVGLPYISDVSQAAGGPRASG
jgi:serine phosphatase RsbU (regulator of sigma subunit)/anti-sigma regulatory factor (Ser/Thr protein kinase)/anti-anti-sigma regulatory factor